MNIFAWHQHREPPDVPPPHGIVPTRRFEGCSFVAASLP